MNPHVRFIQAEMVRRRLSVTSLAKHVGTDRTTLDKWFKGESRPLLDNFEATLNALGYRLEIVRDQTT